MLPTSGSGYRLRVEPEELDLDRFDILTRSGEAAFENRDVTTQGLPGR